MYTTFPAHNSTASAVSASTTRNASPSTKNHSAASALPLPPTPTVSTHKSKDINKETTATDNSNAAAGASPQDTSTTTSKVSVVNPIAAATHSKKARRGHVQTAGAGSTASENTDASCAGAVDDVHMSSGSSEAAIEDSGSS